jgi:gamma-glutamyltranspeptidase/glutathione hydrolase
MVSGMDALLSDYGTKTYEELLQPAISYCDGFEINAALATRIDAAAGSLSSYSNYVRNGELLSEGDVLVQERLGETLRTLAQEGADSFYHGTIAEQIAAESVLTLDDLAAYETIRTDAVLGQYQGYTVASAAAPFSGVTLIQMLEMAERLEIPDPDEDAKTFLAELQQITLAAHQDRVNGVFDLRFDSTGVDQAERVSDAYIAQMLNLSVEDFEEEEESEDTTAFTIVDSNGMVVSCTNTLSSFFGSKKMAAGFFLNNTGTNFGSGVNAYARGKRPRSHIAPTILRSDDEVIAIASPGGNVIVKVLSTVLMDMLQYHTEPQEAINKQRLLFKKAGLIYYEIGYDTPLLAEVSGKGYALLPYSSHSYFGNVAYASYHTENGFYAATDIRRNGNGVYVNR